MRQLFELGSRHTGRQRTLTTEAWIATFFAWFLERSIFSSPLPSVKVSNLDTFHSRRQQSSQDELP